MTTEVARRAILDSVRVPIWLSLLLVIIYIALGAVMFSMWESVGIASE